MAENKKSFILYADLIHTVTALKDHEAGKLFKHILKYVNDLNPVIDDKLIKIVFEPIKHQLKRDLVKWDETRNQRSLAGIKSGEIRRQKRTKRTNVHFVEQKGTKRTVNVNDNVTVNVNDNVINKDMWISEKKLFLNSYEWKEKICRDKNILMPVLEKSINEYISDIELKEDLKDVKELKRHFINWFNLKTKFSKNGLPGAKNYGKSAGAYDLLEKIRADSGDDKR